MSGLNIVMVIAIILFARLGVRLVMKYIDMKKKDHNNSNDLKEYIKIIEKVFVNLNISLCL